MTDRCLELWEIRAEALPEMRSLGVILSTVAALCTGVSSLCNSSLSTRGGVVLVEAARASLGVEVMAGCSGSSSGSNWMLGLFVLCGSLRLTKMVFFGTEGSGGTVTSSLILALLVITIVGFRKVCRSCVSESCLSIKSKEDGSSRDSPEDIGSRAFLDSTCLHFAKSRSDWLFDRNPPPREVTNFLPGANCL